MIIVLNINYDYNGIILGKISELQLENEHLQKTLLVTSYSVVNVFLPRSRIKQGHSSSIFLFNIT